MSGAAETLFAVVDTARDPRLFPLIEQSEARQCLLAGAIAAPLDRAAPYLVELRPREALYHAWRDIGRDAAWGILVRSGLGLPGLRRLFRRFLSAQLPDGMVVHFRFYDPRVMRTFLPALAPMELAAWFDGVSSYLVETGEAGAFHEFRMAGGRLFDGEAPV